VVAAVAVGAAIEAAASVAVGTAVAGEVCSAATVGEA